MSWFSRLFGRRPQTHHSDLWPGDQKYIVLKQDGKLGRHSNHASVSAAIRNGTLSPLTYVSVDRPKKRDFVRAQEIFSISFAHIQDAQPVQVWACEFCGQELPACDSLSEMLSLRCSGRRCRYLVSEKKCLTDAALGVAAQVPNERGWPVNVYSTNSWNFVQTFAKYLVNYCRLSGCLTYQLICAATFRFSLSSTSFPSRKSRSQPRAATNSPLFC